MLILNKRRVEKLAQKCGHNALEHFRAFLAEVEELEWKTSQDILERFNDAKIIDREKVYFRICFNVYRLEVRISYEEREVNLVWFGTHKEYERRMKKGI